MKLGKRNLYYSLILALIMLSFLVGYFVYMLPSLYVDYMMEQNLKAVRAQHRAYVENESYADVQVKNPTACFSLKIPDEGDSIFFTSKMFSVEVAVKDERIRELFYELRSFVKKYGDGTEAFDLSDMDGQVQEWLDENTKDWEDAFQKLQETQGPSPFEVKILQRQNIEGEWHGEYSKVHTGTGDAIVFEMGVEDANNKYVNYIAVERTNESLVVTFLPVLTPDMNEIRPVVLQSLPMLCAVILLVVLLFSQVYSRGIVTPIVRLVRHTEQMKSSSVPAGCGDADSRRRADEIGMLAVTIDELYCKLKASYDELEEKNQALKEENKRQEVLLGASSHQLKTPIAAALLLVDGMYNQIGKYQDTQKYLPQVKAQLLSMKRMVEDILYLNRCGETLDFQRLALLDVLRRKLETYRIAASDRQISIDIEGEGHVLVLTDETVLSHILDNLLSNAVNYTPKGGRIRIAVQEHTLVIQNYGVTIDGELLPHIFEPFVSGRHERSADSAGSHGLGLYIAAYYAKVLGMQIAVENEEDSVAVTLGFPAKPNA